MHRSASESGALHRAPLRARTFPAASVSDTDTETAAPTSNMAWLIAMRSMGGLPAAPLRDRFVRERLSEAERRWVAAGGLDDCPAMCIPAPPADGRRRGVVRRSSETEGPAPAALLRTAAGN